MPRDPSARVVSVRYTAEEYERLMAQVEAAGSKVSTFVRDKTVGPRMQLRCQDQLSEQIKCELAVGHKGRHLFTLSSGTSVRWARIDSKKS